MRVNRRQVLELALAAACGLAQRRPILAALASTRPADVLPPGGPLTAGRWAMVIDVHKCVAAKECPGTCLRACHEWHNVPALGNPKDEVKWIWKEPGARLFPEQLERFRSGQLAQQALPALCNHCANAPCTRVCPTGATFSRADGIVVMDEHRCIGCRFCMAACPYGSRSFNWKDPRPHLAKVNPDYPTRTKGVVEKCTFCAERLARGQRPICVEACPQGALAFGDLKDATSPVGKLLRENFSIRRKLELGTDPAVYYVV
jgi:molybdopterin-containing oxidoreductase family iron-sulfur binding subunit